jgi:thiol-disulfide isomerase/thioredoxin
MRMIWLLRTLTVLFVLCLAGLVALLWGPLAPGRGNHLAAAEAPAASGIGEFTPLAAPEPAPEVAFTTRGGETVNLADFKGRTVLVNLWATWCVPCIREMPSLDRLQAKLGNELAILAISQDRGGAKLVEPFLQKLDLKALTTYLDPKGEVGHAFGARGLPTSVLIDREGRMVGRLEGAAEWDSPAMTALLRKYIGPEASPVQKVSVGR